MSRGQGQDMAISKAAAGTRSRCDKHGAARHGVAKDGAVKVHARRRALQGASTIFRPKLLLIGLKLLRLIDNLDLHDQVVLAR